MANGAGSPSQLPGFSRHAGPVRRAFWGLADQALSSLTNFVLAIAIARQVAPVQFGAFSLAFAAYLVALSISRALATDPLSIRYSARGSDEWRTASAKATGMALVIGIAGGAVCGLGAVVIGGDVGMALAALAVGLPGLLLQDAWRYVFFAARRGSAAFANDLVWTVALGGALVLVTVAHSASITTFIIAWAAGGAAGAIFGIAQTRLLPAPLRARLWLREHLDIAPRLALEALVLSGVQQVTLALVGIVAGLAAVATVRAGQVLMNALNIATYGIFLFAVPEGVRMLRRSSGALLRLCLVISGGLAAISFLWTGVLLALPDQIGLLLLGETWATARHVILPVGVAQAAAGVQMGAVVGLRALATARRSLRARGMSSTLFLTGGITGANLGGAFGAAWGIAIGVTSGCLLWWYQLLRAMADANQTARPNPLPGESTSARNGPAD